MITIIDGGEASVLFGKARRRILALLYTHTDQSFYLREIDRLTGIGIGPAQRELRKLAKCGILKRFRDGVQVYFQANQTSPIFEDLKAIIIKTAGIGDVIRPVLASLKGKIEFAFIYGSFAMGTETGRSDIDLMIIGDVKHKDVVVSLASVQKQLMREINVSVYSGREINKRIRDKNSFISRVLKSEKIILTGDVNELGLLG